MFVLDGHKVTSFLIVFINFIFRTTLKAEQISPVLAHRIHMNHMHFYTAFSDKDGNTYKGAFVNNALEGQGVYTAADGSIYEGMV